MKGRLQFASKKPTGRIYPKGVVKKRLKQVAEQQTEALDLTAEIMKVGRS